MQDVYEGSTKWWLLMKRRYDVVDFISGGLHRTNIATLVFSSGSEPCMIGLHITLSRVPLGSPEIVQIRRHVAGVLLADGELGHGGVRIGRARVGDPQDDVLRMVGDP